MTDQRGDRAEAVFGEPALGLPDRLLKTSANLDGGHSPLDQRAQRRLHGREVGAAQRPQGHQRAADQPGADGLAFQVQQCGQDLAAALFRERGGDRRQRAGQLIEVIRLRCVGAVRQPSPAEQLVRRRQRAGVDPAHQLPQQHLLAKPLLGKPVAHQPAVGALARFGGSHQQRCRDQFLHWVELDHAQRVVGAEAGTPFGDPGVGLVDRQVRDASLDHQRAEALQMFGDAGQVRLQPVQIGPEQSALVEVRRRVGAAAKGLVEQVQVQRRAHQVAQSELESVVGHWAALRRSPRLTQLVGVPRLGGGEGLQLQIGDLFVALVGEAGEEAGIGQHLAAVLQQIPMALGQGLVGAAAQAHRQAQPGMALQRGQEIVERFKQVGEAVGLVQGIEDQPDAPIGIEVLRGGGVQVAAEVVEVGEGAAGDAGTAQHRLAQGPAAGPGGVTLIGLGTGEE